MKKILFVIVMIAAFSGWKGYSLMMNYYGYCSETGHRLSDKQRLDVAVRHYLGNQRIDHIEIFQQEGLSSDVGSSIYHLNRYKDVEEFFNVNPDCCELKYGGGNVPVVGFWARSRGVGNGYFNFYHKINYIDSRSGREREIQSKYTHYHVDNCGVPKYRVLTP